MGPVKTLATRLFAWLLEPLASDEKACRYLSRFFSSRNQSHLRDNEFKSVFPHLSMEGRSDWEIGALTTIAKTAQQLRASVVYDVGANDGVWSLAFAEAGPRIQVHAFEPLPEVYARLVTRVGGHALITPHNLAFGSSRSELQMYQDEFSPASSLLKMTQRHMDEFPQTGTQHPVRVQVETMDEYVGKMQLPMPDLVKIDVQGYEDEVIAGGKETIRQARYVWVELSLVRLHEGGSTFHTTYTALRDLGYDLFDITYLDRSAKDGSLLQMDALFVNSGGISVDEDTDQLLQVSL